MHISLEKQWPMHGCFSFRLRWAGQRCDPCLQLPISLGQTVKLDKTVTCAPCFGHTVELHQAVTQTQTGPYLISGRWLSSTKLWPMSKETLTQIWVWTQAWQSSYPPQDRPLPCFELALKLDKAFKPRLAQGWWTWQSSGPCPDRPIPCFWHAGEPDRAVTHAQTDPDLAEGRQLSLKKQWSMPRQDLTLLWAEVKLDKAVIHT